MKRIIAAGILLAVIWAFSSWISIGLPDNVCVWLKTITFGLLDNEVAKTQNGFHYDVSNKSMPTVIFLILFSVAFLIYFAVSIYISKEESTKKGLLSVILFSLLFRLILLPSVAMHENDFYRYLWDGKSFKSGINPYKHPPGDLEPIESGHLKARSFTAVKKTELGELDQLRRRNPIFFDRIGHRWVPTIYPPVAQAVFAFSSVLREDSIFLIKSVFVLFDMLSVIIIALILAHLGKNPLLCIIYGWSPLVLKEIANSGHYDSVAIFFVLFSIFLYLKRRLFAASGFLALAVLTKFFPIALLPFFARRFQVRHVILFLALILFCYIPFIFWQETGVARLFEGMRIYSRDWEYNGSLFFIIKSFFGGLSIANGFGLKAIAGIFFITGAGIVYLKDKKTDGSLLHSSFIVLVLLFMLSPVGDPWYYCWIVPFLCFFPYRSFLILSWLLIFSYLSFSRDLSPLRFWNINIPLLIFVQYVPFFLFFFLEIAARRKRILSYV